MLNWYLYVLWYARFCLIQLVKFHTAFLRRASFMMTSSNGKISALLALCEGNPLVTNGFPSQRTVTWSFEIFFDLRLTKRLSKHSRRRWFETPSRSLWRNCSVFFNTGSMSATLLSRHLFNFRTISDNSKPIYYGFKILQDLMIRHLVAWWIDVL